MKQLAKLPKEVRASIEETRTKIQDAYQRRLKASTPNEIGGCKSAEARAIRDLRALYETHVHEKKDGELAEAFTAWAKRQTVPVESETFLQVLGRDTTPIGKQGKKRGRPARADAPPVPKAAQLPKNAVYDKRETSGMREVCYSHEQIAALEEDAAKLTPEQWKTKRYTYRHRYLQVSDFKVTALPYITQRGVGCTLVVREANGKLDFAHVKLFPASIEKPSGLNPERTKFGEPVPAAPPPPKAEWKVDGAPKEFVIRGERLAYLMQFVATCDSRPLLHYVFLEKDGIGWATDGHTLAVVQDVHTCNEDISVLVPPKQATALRGKKKDQDGANLWTVKEGLARRMGELEGFTVEVKSWEENPPPKWRQVVPTQAQAVGSIGINPTLLQRFLPKNTINQRLILSFSGEAKAIAVRVSDERWFDCAFGVLMPMRVDDIDHGGITPPDWCKVNGVAPQKKSTRTKKSTK